MIALFHIGLYEGNTVGDILPAGCALRKIVESTQIFKAGVQILGDFWRLQNYFNLNPKGAFELSDLHLMITDRTGRYEITGLASLAVLIQTHLGLPLKKDLAVRASTWTSELSYEQKQYAAADAYAGFMVYCCMNAKRKAMDIKMPLPLEAELYEGIPQRKFRQNGPLLLSNPHARRYKITESARKFFVRTREARRTSMVRKAGPQASTLANTKGRTGLKRPGQDEVDDARVRPAKMQRGASSDVS